MTIKQHTIEKKGDNRNQIWEWEETPELLAAIEQLEKSSQAVKDINVPSVFVPNSNFAPPKRRNDDKKS